MGGLSLLHYHNLGFHHLTSIELNPSIAPRVSDTLRAMIPDLTLLDGDGMELVPRAVSDIQQRDPVARIACILDGPKGQLAVDLAKQLAASSALIVLDDQQYTSGWTHAGGLRFHTNSRLWRAALPMEREADLLVDRWTRHYFAEKDVLTILFGDRWVPPWFARRLSHEPKGRSRAASPRASARDRKEE